MFFTDTQIWIVIIAISVLIVALVAMTIRFSHYKGYMETKHELAKARLERKGEEQ